MRLRTEIWVAAYVRRIAAEGAFAYVARRGDADAGAVFIQIDTGTHLTLYIPAPSWDSEDGDRLWRCHSAGVNLSQDQVRSILEREISLDPDIWILDVEDRDGRTFLGDRLVVSDQL